MHLRKYFIVRYGCRPLLHCSVKSLPVADRHFPVHAPILSPFLSSLAHVYTQRYVVKVILFNYA